MTQHDPHDPQAVADREREMLAEAVMRRDAWHALVATPGGRAIVADLLRQSGYLHQSHTPGDPLHTAFREGQRSVGALLFQLLMAWTPAAWPAVHALLAPPADGAE